MKKHKEEQWTTVIKPTSGLFDIDFKELIQYKDLWRMFVKRDIITQYKQTILGTLWFFINPAFTTIMFMVVFGGIAGMSTDGLPQPLFYLSGICLWNYFSSCLNKTSSTFIENQNIFGKVYFPRLIMKIHGKVIVLEDDLVTSPNFLSFMNQALDYYQKMTEVISVSGCTYLVTVPESYPYDVYFTKRMSSCGWGTWQDRWAEIDWNVSDYSRFKYSIKENLCFMKGGEDLPRMLSAYMKGKINSWAIRFAYHQYKTNTYSVYPVESKLDNIGFNSEGTNTKTKKKYDEIIFQPSSNESFRFSPNPEINKPINKSFLQKYRTINRIIANYFS